MSLFVPEPVRKGQNDQSAAGTSVGTTFPEPCWEGTFFLGNKISVLGGLYQSKPDGVLELF